MITFSALEEYGTPYVFPLSSYCMPTRAETEIVPMPHYISTRVSGLLSQRWAIAEGGWLGEASPRAPGRAPTSAPCVQVSAGPAGGCSKQIIVESTYMINLHASIE